MIRAQTELVLAADEPFQRPGIRFRIGPTRYSFDRIAQEFGSTHSAKGAFRFDVGGLRQLAVALEFPPVVRVRDRNGYVLAKATGEEALCVLLKRLSYPSNFHDFTWEAGRSTTQLCHIFQWSIDHI